jgi:general secretion pathway protein K
MVLWAMGLVALSVGAVSERMTHQLRMSRLATDQLQRSIKAHAALSQAMALLTTDDPAVDDLHEPWATALEASTTLVDESRKLNLNTASVEALTRLITQIQPDPQLDAAGIAGMLADWRDAPEGSFCDGRSPACHNAPLNTVDELRLVPGMTPALFDACAPYVTIYGDGRINLNTADPIVLSAVGLTAPQVATILQQRALQPYAAIPQGLPDGCCGVSSTQFEAQILATLPPASTSTRLRAVFDRSGTIYE